MRHNQRARQIEPEFLTRGPAKGGSGDFERTAIPHMNLLHNYALHLTMDPDDAKDLLQETYLKAFRFWDRFEKGTNIKGWLYQIMKNSYINRYRKRAKEPRPVEFDEGRSHEAYANDTPSDRPALRGSLPHEMFEDEIARSLESLPGDFRTVVMLSDVEDLSYEEIANSIAVPLGTVRSRLHRGRRMLRKKLHDYAINNRSLL